MISSGVFLGVISVTSALLLGQVSSPALPNEMRPYGVAVFYRVVHACAYWNFFYVIVGTMFSYISAEFNQSDKLESKSQPIFLLVGLFLYCLQSVFDVMFISHYGIEVIEVKFEDPIAHPAAFYFALAIPQYIAYVGFPFYFRYVWIVSQNARKAPDRTQAVVARRRR